MASQDREWGGYVGSMSMYQVKKEWREEERAKREAREKLQPLLDFTNDHLQSQTGGDGPQEENQGGEKL